jgi:hypothetical protein
MKLRIRSTDCGIPGIILTDEHGAILPGQRRAVLHEPSRQQIVSQVEDLTILEVAFVVDGRDISFEPDVPAPGPYQLAEASRAYASLSPANRARFCTMYGLAPISGEVA